MTFRTVTITDSPPFEVELERTGSIKASIRTDFEAIEINQTHHKIYLDIASRVGILTPFDTFGKDINTEVLLTEAVIVGEVPDTYYNLSGFEDAEETYNFVEQNKTIIISMLMDIKIYFLN